MRHLLALDHFINYELLNDHDQIPTDAFGLVGTRLGQWLKARLQAAGVRGGPQVKGHCHPKALLEGEVYIAPEACVEAYAYIKGPAYIGPKTQVRHGAYIRGNAFTGSSCVVGHASEVKNAVLFDRAKAAHFAYVGDSILGHGVNLGAGTKLANVSINSKAVRFTDPSSGQSIDSGYSKLGSILGDGAQTGCNAVLSPGSLLLPHTAVLPNVHFRGTLRKGWAK